jgi:predicted dehydrogenase
MVEGSSLTKDSVMTLHCAFIGFGKSTTRYHLPYVLHRKDRWQVHLPPPGEAREQAPQYSHIHFTSDLDEVLNDPQVKLVVVCTHADSHFEYAKKALEAGKTCWWKSRSPRRWRKQKPCLPWRTAKA